MMTCRPWGWVLTACVLLIPVISVLPAKCITIISALSLTSWLICTGHIAHILLVGVSTLPWWGGLSMPGTLRAIPAVA
jgi:hypothetical protein